MTFRQALGRNRCTTSTHLSRHVLSRISVGSRKMAPGSLTASCKILAHSVLMGALQRSCPAVASVILATCAQFHRDASGERPSTTLRRPSVDQVG
jgi:hypothetical protein